MSLGSCELFVSEGFLDQLSDQPLLWQQFIRVTTPELIAGFCIVRTPEEAAGACCGRLPRGFQLFSAHALSSCQLISNLLPLCRMHSPDCEVGGLEAG